MKVTECLPRFGWNTFKHLCTLEETEDVWTLDEGEELFNLRVIEFNRHLKDKFWDDYRFDYITMRG